MSERIWIRRFLEAATHRATFSKDPSTKVGAVITQPNMKNDISYGYNGYPKGVLDVGMDIRQYKYDRTIHAELNAILNSNESLEGCVIFCTLAPCNACAAAIIQKGIKKVYHIQENFESNDRWIGSHEIALDMFDGLVECIGVRANDEEVHAWRQKNLIQTRKKKTAQ